MAVFERGVFHLLKYEENIVTCRIAMLYLNMYIVYRYVLPSRMLLCCDPLHSCFFSIVSKTLCCYPFKLHLLDSLLLPYLSFFNILKNAGRLLRAVGKKSSDSLAKTGFLLAEHHIICNDHYSFFTQQLHFPSLLYYL